MKKKNFLRKLSITVLASLILSSALSFTGGAMLPAGDEPTPTPTPGLVNGFEFAVPYTINGLSLTTIDEKGMSFLPPATYSCLLTFRINDANNRHLTVTGGMGSMDHHVLFVPRTIDVVGLGAFTVTEFDAEAQLDNTERSMSTRTPIWKGIGFTQTTPTFVLSPLMVTAANHIISLTRKNSP